ncbi:MAG TPA: thioredoxin-dependent thiol peroxidase [Saprospiraceae bacterium]|nr:thioredoxin-dependent thiol peroxidase [Saprospiraceae bacterium]HMQ82514.1 thioredoxin-dependent thiol peroxidase [Saprospiraceae bacterium]
MTHLQVGDQAPGFEAKNQLGEVVRLSDYRGKRLILFFYPQDNSPSCNNEVCNLRDNYQLFQKQGYELLGVSPDTEKRHQNFIKKFDLPFPLLADTDRAIIRAYGLWGEKKFMGRTFDGVHRTTFIINKKGVIEQVFTKVVTKNHAAQILEEV